MASGQLIVNPGSVGVQAYEHDDPEYHIMQTGSPDARYAILEKRREGWLVDLISLPYDTRLVVELAGGNGRPEWAAALATGCFAVAHSAIRPVADGLEILPTGSGNPL
jgi:hypothetical protein